MVEPSEYSEIFINAQNISSSFADIKALCDHTVYSYRFNVDKVKKLSKFIDNLQGTKNLINDDLEKIQNLFDNIETTAIVYLHNLKKVQDELMRLADLQQEEIIKTSIRLADLQEEEKNKMQISDNNDEKSENVIISG